MGKPTFDNGIPRPCSQGAQPGERRDRIRLTAAHCVSQGLAQAMPGFGLPLSKEGMRLPNKIGGFKQTRGTETSQYPEERTSTETPLVVASERGPGQWHRAKNRNRLESRAIAGDSPVPVESI